MRSPSGLGPALWSLGGSPADVDPSGEQARRWLADELARDDYSDGRSLFQRAMEWLSERLADLLSPDGATVGGAGAPPILVALAAVLLVGALALVLTRVRGERRTVVEGESAVLGDLDLTAAEFRDRGSAALRDRRWGEAVVQFTRAIAREAADRTLLADAPSLTAHEVGAQLTPVFPDHAPAIARAMDLFDAVRYGRYAAAEPDARHVAEVEGALRRARPVLASAAAAPAGSSDLPVTPPVPPVPAGAPQGRSTSDDR